MDEDLQRELDRAEVRRRHAEAHRQEQEAKAIRARLWLDVTKWAVAAGGLVAAVFQIFRGG